MKCGIVILNYNNFELTCNLVKQCSKINEIDKIVLIDNNSNDNFFEFSKSYSKVEYIKNINNTGYASGNNIGLKRLYDEGYDIAFIANPDVWFESNTISSILKFFQDNKNEYAIVSSKRIRNGVMDTRQYWKIPTFKISLFESLYIFRKFYTKKTTKKTVTMVLNNKTNFIDVEVVGGAFFGMNLKIINEIEYLDEKTFLWYEENILSYKLKQNGYKVAVLTNCIYEHNHIKKEKGNKKFKIFLNSKRYFCEEYLKINFFQKLLLNVFDSIGNLEEKIFCMLK